MTTSVLSGGCQCGAVRYHVKGALSYPHICHCRMCQKASGNYFMPLAGAHRDDFSLTRGAPGWFHSSDQVRRGFCADCGTPLFFETISADSIAVTLGSLDDPKALSPVSQDGVEGRLPFFHTLAGLRAMPTDRSDLPGGTAAIAASNHQHPDHDTEKWPENEKPDAGQ